MALINRSQQPHPTTATSKNRRKSLIFITFVNNAIVVIRFTPVKDYLTTEALTTFLENADFWAPVVYIITYAVGGVFVFSFFIPKLIKKLKGEI